VNHFDSSSKLYFGINVSVSKLMHNAPMEAVVFFSGLMGVWESNAQFFIMFPWKEMAGNSLS